MADEAKKQVEFSLYAPDAQNVFVAGQFNDWNTKAVPLKKGKDGTWKVRMRLPRGRCEYKYFVDGAWMQDAPGCETSPNAFGTTNCVVDVQ